MDIVCHRSPLVPQDLEAGPVLIASPRKNSNLNSNDKGLKTTRQFTGTVKPFLKSLE
jgi:hypothetical protein